MIAAVADTHAAVWYLFGDQRLSPSTKVFIDHAAERGQKVALSAISLAELLYLTEKKRLPTEAYERLRATIRISDYVIDETPLTSGVVETMKQISRSDVPDLPDRIVAATALYFGVPVISRDSRIRASQLQTIW